MAAEIPLYCGAFSLCARQSELQIIQAVHEVQTSTYLMLFNNFPACAVLLSDQSRFHFLEEKFEFLPLGYIHYYCLSLFTSGN